MGGPFGTSIEDDIRLMSQRMKQLKLEYEQYFLGNRPTEPHVLRGEMQKLVAFWSSQAIQNTAIRFRFNSLCARFFALRRQWDQTLRKIEDGTYEPHLFKARLRDRSRGGQPVATSKVQAAPSQDDLYQELIDARLACGQGVSGLTRDKVAGLLRSQEEALRKRFGSAKVQFRVVVEQGKARLKATPIR